MINFLQSFIDACIDFMSVALLTIPKVLATSDDATAWEGWILYIS